MDTDQHARLKKVPASGSGAPPARRFLKTGSPADLLQVSASVFRRPCGRDAVALVGRRRRVDYEQAFEGDAYAWDGKIGLKMKW